MINKIPRRLFAASAAALFGIAGRTFADNPKSTAEFNKIGDPDLYEFTMSGMERHFGLYSAFGEMRVTVGEGVVVLTAANGDQIVGVVNAAAEEDDRSKLHVHFSWRDTVTVGGRNYANTGRFAKHRPPGLVVVNIVAVFLGLLFPGIPR